MNEYRFHSPIRGQIGDIEDGITALGIENAWMRNAELWVTTWVISP
jgi:hypothetical protein